MPNVKVPGEGFGAHVGHRHPQPLLLQVVGDVEHELVGRAESGRALRRPDDNRPGIVQEASPALRGVDGAF